MENDKDRKVNFIFMIVKIKIDIFKINLWQRLHV